MTASTVAEPVVADPVDEVHPRIQRRRAEVTRGRRRRRTRVLWSAFAAGVVVVAGIGSLFSPLLDVDRVAVTVAGGPAGAGGPGGAGTAPAAAVRAAVEAASGVHHHDALVGVDAAAVRRRVERLPWVAHAWVATRWPDLVTVRVLPERLVARVAEGTAAPTAVGTVTGRVMPAAAMALLGPLDGVRVLHVPAGRAGDADTARALTVLHKLPPAATAALGDVTLGDDGTLVFAAAPGPLEGAEVVFGTLDLVPQKLQALEAAVGGRVDRACVARVDVSVPTRLTIVRRPGCPPSKG